MLLKLLKSFDKKLDPNKLKSIEAVELKKEQRKRDKILNNDAKRNKIITLFE